MHQNFHDAGVGFESHKIDTFLDSAYIVIVAIRTGIVHPFRLDGKGFPDVWTIKIAL